MRTQGLVAALATFAMASSANASMIAGWDFSQYFGSGSLAVTSPANSYSTFANYSDLDLATPVAGLGAGATQFGTMYHDGQFGSSNSAPGLDWSPISGELAANADAPGVGTNMSEAGSILALTSEAGSPQLFGNALRMAAIQALDVVFQADLSTNGPLDQGTDWVLSFGAQSSVGPIDIDVEFSTDGVTYNPVTTFVVNTEDVFTTAAFSLPDAGQSGFFRLGAVSGFQLDNVAIDATPVPEPSTALLLTVGLAGLMRASRRRA